MKLAETHTGMRVSASGMIKQSCSALRKSGDNGLAWQLEEMLKLLGVVGKEYYAGREDVVDEFLQLYCLDDERPKQ